jgi:hypothetical protein
MNCAVTTPAHSIAITTERDPARFEIIQSPWRGRSEAELLNPTTSGTKTDG